MCALGQQCSTIGSHTTMAVSTQRWKVDSPPPFFLGLVSFDLPRMYPSLRYDGVMDPPWLSCALNSATCLNLFSLNEPRLPTYLKAALLVHTMQAHFKLHWPCWDTTNVPEQIALSLHKVLYAGKLTLEFTHNAQEHCQLLWTHWGTR